MAVCYFRSFFSVTWKQIPRISWCQAVSFRWFVHWDWLESRWHPQLSSRLVAKLLECWCCDRSGLPLRCLPLHILFRFKIKPRSWRHLFPDGRKLSGIFDRQDRLNLESRISFRSSAGCPQDCSDHAELEKYVLRQVGCRQASFSITKFLFGQRLWWSTCL